MSEAVERRLLDVLGHPTESPYGNPIPGLAELGERPDDIEFRAGLVSLDQVAEHALTVVVRRIGEPIQSDTKLMWRLRRAGVRPNTPVRVARVGDRVVVGTEPEVAEIDDMTAAHMLVSRSD